MVMFRNGWVTGPHKASEMKWSDSGEWTPEAVEYAPAGAQHSATPPEGWIRRELEKRNG